jgi:hypothetical protein
MGAATHHHPHRLSSVTVRTILAPPPAVRAAASDSKSVARSDHESCGQVGRAVGEGGHALGRTGRDFVSQPGLTSVLELGSDATVLKPSPAAFPLPLSPLLGPARTRVLAAHPRRWHRRHQLLDSNPPGPSLPADRGGSVSAAASAFPNIRTLDLVRADPTPRRHRHVLAHDRPLRGLAREYTHSPFLLLV